MKYFCRPPQLSRQSFLSGVLAVGLFLALPALILGASATYAQTSPLRANGKIAFTSDRDGNQEIYTMNADGTGQVRLTNNPGTDNFPAFSPDGRRIAFVSQNASGAFAIKIMNADGTNQTQLTPIAFDNSPYPWHEKWALSWSPDGRKIAFQENGEIFTVNVDGSNRTNLTNNPAQDIEPSWSADGSRIVFISSRVPYLTMFTMKADGSDVRALPSAGEFWDMSPDWSPTGDKIAFVVHSESFLPILYTANADGTNRQIFDGGGDSTHRNKPKWSPDGTKIVFHIWEYFSNDAEIYVGNVDGSGFAQLTNTSGRNFQPAWQPLSLTSPTANPIDEAQFFVRQQYLDFLNREPDAGGLAYWTQAITQCGSDQDCINRQRISVSAAFFIEQEFQLTGNYVYRMYTSSYGQRPPYAQFMPDRARINPNADQIEASKQQFADLFVLRPEFLAKYPATLTPEAFVDALIATVKAETNGAVDLAAQRSALLTALQTSGRGSVVRQVAENKAFQTAEYNKAFVTMQYFGYLRRDPEDNGYSFWLDVLNNRVANNYRAMVCAFVNSAEYQFRFGTVRTRTDKDCSH